MRLMRFTKISLILIFILLGISACTVLGGSADEATPTPLPTSIVSGLQVIPPAACQIAERGMIQVENPQGDLIAWSLVDDTVAYVASTAGSSWNVGELDILSAPEFDSPTRLATQVAGELTWSPGASAIAYLGLRRSDDLYTIGLAYPGGRISKDLFPDEAARTDEFSSQKSILEWMDADRLRILVSCGDNCLQTLDYDTQSGLSTPVGDPIERYWEMWAAHTYHPADIPEEYAKLSGQLNWSWDDHRIAYIDEHGNAWVINVVESTIYPLGIGQYGTATESDWSYDNKYIAVQVDQNLLIFAFECP